jgi:DNA polymerase III tau subunit V interacting with alpha
VDARAASNPFAAAAAALKGEDLPNIEAANEDVALAPAPLAPMAHHAASDSEHPYHPALHATASPDDDFDHQPMAMTAAMPEHGFPAPAFEPYFENKPAPPNATALMQNLLELPFDERWVRLSQGLKLPSGPTRELVENALLRAWQKQDFQLLIQLTVDESHQALASNERVREIEEALQTLLRSNVVLSVRVEDADLAQSPASVAARAHAHAAQEFAASIEQHPLVSALVQNFDASIVPGSIQFSGKARTH